MTNQKDLNKDVVALLSSVTDSIHQLRSEVVALRSDMNSQHMRNNNFNDRLINLEENKMKVIDEENGWYWKDTRIVRINNAEDIDRDKIKIMKDYGVAYEHSI